MQRAEYPIISLLLPTRGRPQLVQRLFQSITESTQLLNQVEVILYIDDDDINSHQLTSKNFEVIKIIGPKKSMGGYNRACFEWARGEIIILVNDDVVIRSQDWDMRVRELHAKFDDKIYLGFANDLFKKRSLSTFPIMSRRTCELLVEPYPEVYRRFFIDTHLFDIFKRLEHVGHERLYYLKDVVFEHLHYRARKALIDQTYSNAIKERFVDDMNFVLLADLRRATANRLISTIRKMPICLNKQTKSIEELPSSLMRVIKVYTCSFLFDGGLPYKWRVYLWYWLLGRYLVGKGYFSSVMKLF